MVESTIALPAPEDVEKIWSQYATPLHIRAHMKQVNRVAMYIATRLNSVGEHVILPLVDRASLLHDTIRVTDWDELTFEYFPYTPTEREITVWKEQRNRFPASIAHAQVNEQIFKEQYPEMAQVIAMHSIGSTPYLKTWEEKIVNYADRRVAHTTIVTVAQRLEESRVRYSRIQKNSIEENSLIVDSIFQLEHELFSRIDENPNQLLEE